MSAKTIRAGHAIRPPRVSSREVAKAFRRLQERRPDKYPTPRKPKQRFT